MSDHRDPEWWTPERRAAAAAYGRMGAGTPRRAPLTSAQVKVAEARFWTKVDKSGPNGCWMWTGGKNEDGYGQFWLSAPRRREGAHRVAYRLLVGTIPKGMWVLHSCDNPPCVNPAHLRLGTPLDNAAEMAVKGHVATMKVTPNEVREIRARHADGESQSALGRWFGLTPGTVMDITKRTWWKHVADDPIEGHPDCGSKCACWERGHADV